MGWGVRSVNSVGNCNQQSGELRPQFLLIVNVTGLLSASLFRANLFPSL